MLFCFSPSHGLQSLKAGVLRLISVIMLILLVSLGAPVVAQSQPVGVSVDTGSPSDSTSSANPTASASPENSADGNVVNRLHVLAIELDNLLLERLRLVSSLENVPESEKLPEREQLEQLTRTIETLESTFEITALAGVDTGRVDEPDEEYNWRSELIEIASPVLDSLKTVTEKPRRKAELLAQSEQLKQRYQLALDASDALALRQDESDRPATSKRLALLADKWGTQISEMEQQQVLVSQQLESIENNDTGFLTSFGHTFQAFFLGRGLTIFLAFLGAMVAWGLAKFLWWFAC